MSKIQTIHTPGKLENIAINGALDFWQEKAGTTTTVNTATGATVWIADMIRASHAGTSVKNFSVVRSANVPDISQCAFDVQYSSQFTQITGIPSLASTDIINPYLYSVEGYDYQRIHGKKVTFGIWVFSSVAGTYSFGLRNSAATRSYVTTYTINQANTWEFKSITVQMDTSTSGYDFTNGVGILVSIGSVAGSSNVQSPSSTWQNNGLSVANTATNWAGTSGAVLRFSLFSIVEGTLGFGPKGFQRAGNDVQAELAMCQRYYELGGPGAIGAVGVGYVSRDPTAVVSGGTAANTSTRFSVEKRATPSLTLYGVDGTGTTPNTINNSGTSRSASAEGLTSTGFRRIQNNSGVTWTAALDIAFNWVADARF